MGDLFVSLKSKEYLTEEANSIFDLVSVIIGMEKIVNAKKTSKFGLAYSKMRLIINN